MEHENGTQVKLARLEERLKDVQKDVHEIRVSIDGEPFDRSIRGRLHKLEASDSAVAILAKSKANSFTKRQIIWGLLIAAIAVGLQVVTVIVIISNGSGTP